jgi:hypothetical protein
MHRLSPALRKSAGREQKWKIGDDPDQQKRHRASEVADPDPSGAGTKVESAFFVDLCRRIGGGEDLDYKSSVARRVPRGVKLGEVFE